MGWGEKKKQQRKEANPSVHGTKLGNEAENKRIFCLSIVIRDGLLPVGTECVSLQPFFHFLFSTCRLFWCLMWLTLCCVGLLFLSTFWDFSDLCWFYFSALPVVLEQECNHCQNSWFCRFWFIVMFFPFLYAQRQIICPFPPTLLLALNWLPSNIYYWDSCHRDAWYLPGGM